MGAFHTPMEFNTTDVVPDNFFSVIGKHWSIGFSLQAETLEILVLKIKTLFCTMIRIVLLF